MHVAVADMDATYGAYVATEYNTMENTNNNNAKNTILGNMANYIQNHSSLISGAQRAPGGPLGPNYQQNLD